MPNDLSSQLGNVFGAFFSNDIVHLVLSSIVLYLFIVWLAAAYWAYRDMHDRTENPALPYVAAVLILVTTPFLFVLGVIVYRVIRPSERLGEVYERNLAEEALLAEVEAVKTCRGCDRRVDAEWIICPWCRTRLNRVCPNCERLVGLDWTLCAWCGNDFERPAVADRAIAGGSFGVPRSGGVEQPLPQSLPQPLPQSPQQPLPQSLPGSPASGTITNRKPAIGG